MGGNSDEMGWKRVGTVRTMDVYGRIWTYMDLYDL